MVTAQTNVYDSSTIDASTYVYETKELFVNFKNAVYVYEGVEVEDYLEFANDKSQGIALNRVIKPKYKYLKIEDAVQE